MAKFRCKVCGFLFEKMEMPRTCPYCGKIEQIEEEKNVDELIESSS